MFLFNYIKIYDKDNILYSINYYFYVGFAFALAHTFNSGVTK